MLTSAKPFLPSGVVGASARQAGATTTRAQVDVLHRQFVASDASRLKLVREAAFEGGIKQVVALGGYEQMGWVHAQAIVAGVADNAVCGNGAVMDQPRVAVRRDVASDPGTSIAVNVEQARPFPAAVRFPNLRPKTRSVFLRIGRALIGWVDAARHTTNLAWSPANS